MGPIASFQVIDTQFLAVPKSSAIKSPDVSTIFPAGARYSAVSPQLKKARARQQNRRRLKHLSFRKRSPAFIDG
jgi:hypothetical protein